MTADDRPPTDRQGAADTPALLASHVMPLPATFRFQCWGRRFDAAIRARKGGGAELVVRGSLGAIPYSAESIEARRHIQSIVDAAMLIEDTEVSVHGNQAVYARRLMGFSSTPSPSYVAAGATVMAISLKPLCEIMRHGELGSLREERPADA